MSELPRVSVVVPFHDSRRTLAACVESLLAQRRVGGPFEILLIDNGGSDGSAAIAGRYREVRLLEEGKPGAYAARNRGVAAARGPVIALTDADCVADSDWLRSILDGMAAPDTAVLVGHCRYPREASLALRVVGTWENAKLRYVLESCPPRYHFAWANNMAVRASVFRELGPFREWPRAADSELVHRLAARRPDLSVLYRPSMCVTHLEFVRGLHRLRRMRLYRKTNSRIPTFRELGTRRRLGVLVRALRDLAG